MDDISAIPASGPQLNKAIGQAIEHLNKVAVKRNYQENDWPTHARLWKAILTQSKNRLDRQVAPNLVKSDLAIPALMKLDGRDWKSFGKWFERVIESELLQLSQLSRIPALRVIRHANAKGGYSEKSGAIYYLSFFSASKAIPENASQQPNKLGNAWQKLTNKKTTPSNAEDHQSSISSGVSSQRRWRFSVSMVLLGIFLLIFCMFLPADSRRVMFIIFSVVLLIVGLWGMDKANKEEVQ